MTDTTKPPWETEPAQVRFTSHGFPCLVRRNLEMKFLCGYVAVPPGHPWHGKFYDDVPADVHGGLTFSDACRGDICHKPEPGEPDDVWWLGFDCGHAGDLNPGMRQFDALIGLETRDRGDVYRTVEYVSNECIELAKQAHEQATT